MVHFSVSRSTSVWGGSRIPWECGHLRVGVIARGDTVSWTEDCSALGHLIVCGALCHDSLADMAEVQGGPVGVVTLTLRMLTKWFQTTRLETRTKESNKYASIWVANPYAE